MPPANSRRPVGRAMPGSVGRKLPAGQRGAALLILLALIIPVLLYALVAGLQRSGGELARARDQKTYEALAQAKAALIAYAVTYKETHDDPASNIYYVPGYLPCPDLGIPLFGEYYEGAATGSCDNFLVSSVGRFPWKTLGLEALRDDSGECLWYAVSGTYKNNPNGVTSNNTTSNNMMNWDTNGQFKVMDANGIAFLTGSTEDSLAVAVIFAPGKGLSGQDRTPAAGTANCGGNYNAAAYLDTANGINNSTLVTPSSPGVVTDVSTFIAGTAGDTFNDKLVYITRADIWNAIKKRSDFNNYLRALTRRATECTAMYGTMNSAGANDKRLPWAADVFMSSLDRYAVDRRYRDIRGDLSGRFPYRVSNADADTSNLLNTNTDLGYSNILLPTSGSYCAYTPAEKIWYDNWKDQLFYAVANNFQPYASWWWPSWYSNYFLNINGSGNYAAAVIFSGEKLSGQNRNTLADKSLISNYLEGRNSSNHPNSGGNGNYQAAAASASFNDIVYAIDGNLNVSCSDATGVMRPVPAAAVAPPGNPAAYAACP